MSESALPPIFLDRFAKDMADLQEKACTVIEEVPSQQEFIVSITPPQGIWKDHAFKFSFKLPREWPYHCPVVKCLTRIWHPNINEEGDVCVNTLRASYAPQLTLSALVESLFFIFRTPNPTDNINKEAGDMYQMNIDLFIQKANEYMDEYCE